MGSFFFFLIFILNSYGINVSDFLRLTVIAKSNGAPAIQFHFRMCILPRSSLQTQPVALNLFWEFSNLQHRPAKHPLARRKKFSKRRAAQAKHVATNSREDPTKRRWWWCCWCWLADWLAGTGKVATSTSHDGEGTTERRGQGEQLVEACG